MTYTREQVICHFPVSIAEVWILLSVRNFQP